METHWAITAISVAGDLFTVAASTIAIYLFIFKKEEINAAFQALIGYTFRLTLRDLERQLDDLNRLNADAPSQKTEIIGLLAEILGRARGDLRVGAAMDATLRRLETLLESPNAITQPKLRGLISELRGRIETAEVSTFRTRR
jgi:hypothetical protein